MYQLTVLSSNDHTGIKHKCGHAWPHQFGYTVYITVRTAVVLSDSIANCHINKYPEHCDSNKKQICFQAQTHCEVFLCTTHTFRHSVFSVVTQKSLNLNRCLSVFIIVYRSSAVFYSHSDNFKDRNTPDNKLWTNNIAPSFSLCCRFWLQFCSQASCVNTFTASYLNTQGLNNSCLKSPASTSVDLTFQSRALRSFSLNQLRNLSL